MADISDVEQAVANTVAAILYPNGSDQASIVGVLCRVYRGWPNSATLNADLSAGVVNVTIVSDNDGGHTTTRYLLEWRSTLSAPGVVASASSQTITIAGNPAPGDIVGVLVNGATYSYRIQAGDSVELVASNLNQVIQSGCMSVVSGSIITIPGARSVTVRAVCDQAASSETRRQEKDLRIICWAPSPQVRDSIVGAIDAAINQISFLQLADGSDSRVIYRKTASFDQSQNALLYRRDLVYLVEYPTLATVMQPAMLFGASGINGNISYG